MERVTVFEGAFSARAPRAVFAAAVGFAALAAGQAWAGPGPQDYRAAEALIESNLAGLVKNEAVEPHWIGSDGAFWYRRDVAEGQAYVRVDPKTGARSPLFDHAALARALNALPAGKSATAGRLGLSEVRFDAKKGVLEAKLGYQTVSCDLGRGVCVAPPPVAYPLLTSANGVRSVFVKDDNLWLRDEKTGAERALTDDGQPNFSWGKLPESSLLTIPTRKYGLKFPPIGAALSPDGRWLFAVKLDERKVGLSPFVEHVPTDGSMRPKLYQIHSPIMGDADGLRSELFLFDLETGAKRAIALETAPAAAFEVFGWDGSDAAFATMAAPGLKSVTIVRVDLSTGAIRPLFGAASQTRVELNAFLYNAPNLRVLGGGREILWYAQTGDGGRLELRDGRTGALKRALTDSSWPIWDLVRVDEKGRTAFFTAPSRNGEADPYLRQLWRVGLDRGDPVMLTQEGADHLFEPPAPQAVGIILRRKPRDPEVSPDGAVFIDVASTVDKPPVSTLRSTRDGRAIAELERADATALFAAGYRPPERLSTVAADGKTRLWAAYWAPGSGVGKPVPVIDSAYGGPQVFVAPQNFMEGYRGRGAAFARLGFAVVTVDGRGTPGRGLAFRDAGYPEFTRLGIEDHIAAIKGLAQTHPEMDLTRVGVIGWSWGGTFAAQAVLSHGEFYKAAVSGAGLYDYAASYPGFEAMTGLPDFGGGASVRPRPDSRPINWAPLDITAMAPNLTGRLMLIAGELDENVPNVQVIRLIDALTRAQKRYDYVFVPNGTHAAGRDGYVIRRGWDFFIETLMDQSPPADMAIRTKPPAP